MGVSYYHSSIEKGEIEAKIHERKLEVFHTDFVDEQGNPTDGNIGRIIYGHAEKRGKTIETTFKIPSANFDEKFSKIKRLVEIIPTMYDIYQQTKIDAFRKILGIKDLDEQRAIIEELRKKISFENNLSEMGELYYIHAMKLQEDFKKTDFKITQTPELTSAWRFIFDDIKDLFHLERDPSFLLEMSLVYLVSVFEDYLTSIIEYIFRLNPNLLQNSLNNKCNTIQEKEKFVLREIVHGINETRKTLKDYFSIEFDDNLWEEFAEIFFRRNILVHNKGVPTEYYRCRFRKYIDKKTLEINKEYFYSIMNLFDSNQQYINNLLWKKFVEQLFLDEMSNIGTLE